MGGINCPPGKRTDTNPGEIEKYIRDLAEYSQSLFDSISAFYSANSKIEQAILEKNEIDKAKKQLSNCYLMFQETESKLSIVANMWNQVSDKYIDFTKQFETLSSLTKDLNTTINKINMGLNSNGLVLQNEIWDRPRITSSLTKIVNSINEAMKWQSDFANNKVTVNISQQ